MASSGKSIVCLDRLRSAFAAAKEWQHFALNRTLRIPDRSADLDRQEHVVGDRVRSGTWPIAAGDVVPVYHRLRPGTDVSIKADVLVIAKAWLYLRRY
jgi:hypothetical protein